MRLRRMNLFSIACVAERKDHLVEHQMLLKMKLLALAR